MSHPVSNLADQRCFHHAQREAAARCPECARFFCRECITEHDDRVLCAACLARLSRRPLFRRPAFAGLLRFGQFLAGWIIAWVFFYLCAELLLALPSAFHEGTLWKSSWFGL